MIIRQATPSDIVALSELARVTFSETFAHLYPPEDLQSFLTSSYSTDTLRDEITRKDQYWALCTDALGLPLGYVQACSVGLPHPEAKPECEGEIKRLYVLGSAQAKGIGQVLLKTGLRYLDEHYGLRSQWIGVWSENHGAQRLYGRFGFEKVGEYGFPVGNTVDHEFILRRITKA
jgi:diamine N-acetyltransferase